MIKRTLIRLLAVLAVLTIFASSARAEASIYYYRDEHGNYYFTDMPDSHRYRPFYIAPGMPVGMDRGEIERLVKRYSSHYGIDYRLAMAVIEVESSYRADAVSRAGAEGLMQIMPETQRDLGVTRPFDPEQNIEGGIRYLSMQLERFKSVKLALAAYNAGPEAVQRYGGVPPYSETQSYVRRVLSIYERLKRG